MPDFQYSAGDHIRWSGKEWTVIERIHTDHRQAYRVTEDVSTESPVLRPSRPEVDATDELVTSANNAGTTPAQ